MSIPADPSPDDRAEDAALKRAIRTLANNREGKASFDEHVIPIRFIRTPKAGNLLASVPVAMLMSDEVILFVPDERDDALQLLVTVEEVGESALTDHYIARFPEPEHVRWAEMWIDAGRLNEFVFDGDALMIPNPLDPLETDLLRALNNDTQTLRRATAQRSAREVEHPVAVGVDPLGVDVRARFGIVRLPFERESPDEPSARASIDEILRSAR